MRPSWFQSDRAARSRVRTPSRRHRAWTVALSLILLTSVSAFVAPAAYAVHDEIACNDVPTGYQCTPLLNKGGSGTVIIGELFYKRTGSTLTLLTNMFGEDDTGHVDEKLCVDDDTNPLATQESCVGGSAGQTVTSCAALPTAGAGEEAAGKYEAMIEGGPLAETTETIDGVVLGEYNICVDGYEHFSFHFNEGDFSVESFFSAPIPATKSGTKFEDLNADGDRDAGEPGLAGWEIHIFNSTGTVHLHDTTNAAGNYSFSVPPGSYTVCETQQTNWTQSFPATGADCSAHGGGIGYAITLTAGQDDTGNDFGNFRNATKTGTKFEDLDADGTKDAGEPGLAGWEIHLFGTSGAGTSVHEHTTTNASGAYSFSVPPGSYTVCETQQTNWTQSFPATGADCSAHGGGTGYAITLTSNQTDSGNDFGNFRNATKTGIKFEDLNADGDRDAGEPILAGWEIHLFGTSGAGVSVHEHDTTDAAGVYSFSVPPGTYTVCETIQIGWTQSHPTSGASCTSHGGGLGYAITLTSNQTDSGNDFGNFRLGTKTGTKFEDLNGDGDRDAGEPGLAGWQIHIFDTATGGTNFDQHAITGADGSYRFDVPPGSYTVCETQQVGWTQSFPATGADCSGHGGGVGYNITLVSGGTDSGNDFGNFRNATKTGTKFEDLDADGTKDAGEPGLAGWEIHLFGTDGEGDPVHEHTTTNASGVYSFSVPPGTYTVCETQQVGWTQSFPETGADCSGHGGGTGYAITLTSNQTDSGNDFGNFRNATKTGTKFEDLDADGTKDAGEPGLAGWEIHLFGTDGEGDPVHEHTTTNASGVYSFSVPPGTYTVCETQQVGWTQSFPETGADCSGHGGGTGYAITLTSNQTDSGNDFGNFRNATKTGVKFEDLNADGDRDAGEPILSGWEIHLFGTDGQGNPVHVHDTTDAAGEYSFSVPPGTYTVCETQQLGWGQSMPGSGADCSAHGGGVGYAITLTSNQTDSGNDFGNFRSATKTGTKFEDLNADGDRDLGEPSLPGWEIHLFGTDGQGDPVHLHTTTDGNGDYWFSVAPGSYTVCESQQADWFQSMPSTGADCSGHGGGTGYAITLTSNETDSGNDFGNFRNATKTGEKFEDLNADGDRDAGEPDLAGWEIHLFGTSGAGDSVHVHDTTDAAGEYSFSVPPGNYTVCESIPLGWTQSFPTSGADCSEHGGGLGYTISLDSNETDSGNDFGNFQNATKAGTKFEDLNADGDRDEGEPGLADWEIHIFNADLSVHQHAITDADGDYSFDVPPGAYTVCEEIPEGWTQSFPATGADCSGHGGGVGYAIVLTSGGTDSGNDFGNFQSATVAGAKFGDLNANGALDGVEGGLDGWEVHLFGTSGAGDEVHEHQTTAADGSYSFSVPPGTYTVCESTGPDSAGVPGVSVTMTATPDTGTLGTPITYTYVVTNTGTTTLTNIVVTDSELGEVGTIASLAPGASAELTDGLLLGSEDIDSSVSVTADAGFTQTFPSEGADCSAHGGGFGYTITVTSGESSSGNDFGNAPRNAVAEDETLVTFVLGRRFQRPDEDVLPRTGSDLGMMAGLAVGFLLLGFAMVIGGRRRYRLAVVTARGSAWVTSGRTGPVRTRHRWSGPRAGPPSRAGPG